jgi:hypothetical protein
MSTSSSPASGLTSAVVVRVVGDSLGYVTTRDESRTFAFVPAAIAGYSGESLAELGIREGTAVNVTWASESGEVTRVEVTPSTSSALARSTAPQSGIEAPVQLPERREQPAPSSKQSELHPARQAATSAQARRALPPSTRRFGKLVDTRNLRPGDLLLSRELEPDDVSRRIADIQTEGGYADHDGQWTHAAMYVGDDTSIVEATFDGFMEGGNVRLTSLDEYCNGQNALRFRRSRFIATDRDGWRVCVRAMSRLKEPYSFGYIAQTWFNVVFRKRGFYSAERQRPTTKAVVCSTLYADAYNEALRRSLGEVNGACVPAWLSASDEFQDVQAEWVSVI